MWLEWQRVNTSAHRERFDGGFNARLALTSHLSVPVQIHVVHEGGQLFNTGPVADSAAGAAGIVIQGSERARRHDFRSSCSAWRRNRCRTASGRIEIGTGRRSLAALAAERDGWRAHLIAWRGRDFVKDEGDPNYLSMRRDGSRYGGIRDYAEAGLARRFQLAPGAVNRSLGKTPPHRALLRVFLPGAQHRLTWGGGFAETGDREQERRSPDPRSPISD